ncbi:MAG: hypothetical protein ACOCYB_00950 [Alkalispirochaeta sp.]
MVSWEETLRAVVRRYYRSGTLDPPDWVTEGSSTAPEPLTVNNAMCGDRVVAYVEHLPRSADAPARIWLDVAGCAICKASGEMACRAAEVLTAQELAQFAREMCAWMEGPDGSGDPQDTRHRPLSEVTPIGGSPQLPTAAIPAEDIAAMARLREVPGRRRCASLPWEAVRRVLDTSR